MAKVTGIGGVFFSCADPEATRNWYHEHLGLESDRRWGHIFLWREKEKPEQVGNTVWAPMQQGGEKFAGSQKEYVVNYRVEGIDEMMAGLKAQGVKVLSDVEASEHGKFATIVDPDGVKVELWEPIAANELE